MNYSFLVLLFCAAFNSQAFSKEKKVKLAPPHKIEDPGSATPLIYKSPNEVKDLEPRLADDPVKSICTDNFGMIHKKGTSGYDGCLRNQNTMRPQNASDKNPNSLGITFGN